MHIYIYITNTYTFGRAGPPAEAKRSKTVGAEAQNCKGGRRAPGPYDDNNNNNNNITTNNNNNNEYSNNNNNNTTGGRGAERAEERPPSPSICI